MPLRPVALLALAALAAPLRGQEVQASDRAPYGFRPWHADYPVALELPSPGPRRTYDRSRRQAIERVVANLQGNVRRQVWQMATEFFWRAPDDAIEPLVTAMDRAFSQPPLHDVVRNVIEAMGKMAREEFDDALRRALEHPNPGVVQAALAALGRSGTTATVRRCQSWFDRMDGRARQSWLRAARLRLGSEVVPLFAQLMVPETIGPVRDQVLKETLELPPAAAAAVLRRLWPEAVGEFKAIIAGVFHAAGEVSGTLWLRDALQSQDAAVIAQALKHGTRGPLGPLRTEAMRLSVHPSAEVRLGVARALVREEGPDVDNTYEVLAQPDEVFEIKALALRELTRRGRPGSVSALLEDAATASGTRLEVMLNLLGASGDARAVPIFVERFKRSPPGEGRQFLRALAFCGAAGSEEALLQLFLGPERAVDPPARDGSQLTTLTYIPVLVPNLRGFEDAVIDAFGALPREDHQRRALLLQALANVAGDRNDPRLQARIDVILRGLLFDADELPQLRIQALQSMSMRSLTIDDAMQLKRRQDQEEQPMRYFLQDFLHEFF